jgi:prepilin-type N-terminal cleavage/methylation domain-containing protein
MRRAERAPAGFTLVELSIVLFVLGLVLWTVAPRLSRIGETGRDAAIRAFSAESESAYDASLFEKKEWRLQIDPRNATYRFFSPGDGLPPSASIGFGSGVSVTGITVEGEDRPLDAVVEIRYMPGGRMADALIRLRDRSREDSPSDWTLRLDPASGSVEMVEGVFAGNA